MSQLALNLRLDDHAVFDSFLAAGNETAVAALEAIAAGRERHGAWLWGLAGAGKTHLLQAACERAGDAAMYLPFGSLASADAALLDGLESQALICIDDVDKVAGTAAWERALFRLYNALEERRHTLVIATKPAPRQCNFDLPDLTSRLRRLPPFRLRPLAGGQVAEALHLRARYRGVDLPEETARYLLRRERRDMRTLYALLDRLNTAAVREQRRLTVPFVRDVLTKS